MGQTSPCVLGLFLLMSLHYSGHAEDVVLTLEPNWSTFFTGESVTFICDVKDGEETDWEYRFVKGNWEFVRYNSNKRYTLNLQTGYSGKYQCFARHRRTYEEKRSNIVSLTVSDIPRATLRPGRTTIPAGGRVTLTCSVYNPAEWRYYWYRRTSGSSEDLTLREGYQSREISVSQGGTYWCRGGRGNPLFYTHGSYEVTIQITYRVTLTSQPIWSQMFTGEKITLTCDIQGGGDTEWQYEWTTPWSSTLWTDVNYWSTSAAHSGEYKCRGRNRLDLYSSTQLSEGITKTVSPKPKAQLRADVQEIPAGGSVTLTCSVNPSAGWKYDLYRDNKLSEPLNPHDAAFKTTGNISVSQTGVYRCRGGRGDPVYYTEDSQDIRIVKIAPNRAVMTLEPNWPEIYRGETITVRCEIQGGGDTEWTYDWETSTSLKPPNQHEYRISPASSSHSGDYRCRGRVKSDGLTTTEWSDSVRLTVYDDKPVLTVSPSWLSPGASVTLKCEVGLQSAGWRFFWSKAVPDPSQLSYSSELLPGSSNGTEQDSYMVHGQTHTAGYVCQAGRGYPVVYTETSEPTFVWSGDVDPSASLTVSPYRVQHFTSQEILVRCEGNFTEWRLRRFPKGGYWTCSDWRIKTESTCNIYTYQPSEAVYWCESGSGEFSNSVNITTHGSGLILSSPVRPVTEGESVILSCEFKTNKNPSKVFFYQNNKLIQNDSRTELNISAVSKSDEGFYRCESSGQESPQSWVSVRAGPKPESSSLAVLLIVSLLCGVVLIVVLLVLCRHRRSKDLCFLRSIQSESSTTNHQSESQRNECASPLKGESALYDTIRDCEDAANGASQDVTYSLLELKNIRRKSEHCEPAETSVYSDLKIGATDLAPVLENSPTYVQVNILSKGKGKKKKGKSTPAATDEALYSLVKPTGTSSAAAATDETLYAEINEPGSSSGW